MDLPKASSAEREGAEDLKLIITREETLYLNNQRVTLSELWGKLLDRSRNGDRSFLVIQADRLVAHGRVVEVMDIAKQAGIRRLAIATRAKPQELKR